LFFGYLLLATIISADTISESTSASLVSLESKRARAASKQDSSETKEAEVDTRVVYLLLLL